MIKITTVYKASTARLAFLTHRDSYKASTAGQTFATHRDSYKVSTAGQTFATHRDSYKVSTVGTGDWRLGTGDWGLETGDGGWGLHFQHIEVHTTSKHTCEVMRQHMTGQHSMTQQALSILYNIAQDVRTVMHSTLCLPPILQQ